MNTIETQLPPHSETSEKAALGCIVLCETSTERDSIFAQLRRSQFYLEKHLVLFDAIASQIKNGRPTDALVLYQVLKDRGELENVGGSEYVFDIGNTTPSVADFPNHLYILKDKSWRRECLAMAQRAAVIACDESVDAEKLTREFSDYTQRIMVTGASPRQWFKFYSPGECRGYEPPPGFILVGDCHLTRGSVTVIAGAPGIGKSRAGTALAVAGATGADWFGLPVHKKFKTAILQGENGRYRLKTEFAALDDATLNDFIRVSDRPDYGLAFDSPEFRHALKSWLADFKPDVLLLDPWNGIAHDDRQKDYREAFENIFAVLAKGEDAPAIVIIAHTRKPKDDDRRTGRALLNELSGSHALGSVPRCAFVMQSASDDETDGRVVWTCCKNNDGELGSRTAWHRRNGLFDRCQDFDWDEFDSPSKDGKRAITKEDVEAVFEGGRRRLARKAAVESLMQRTGFKDAACYNALTRFAAHLQEDDDSLLCWTP